jgi:hypothetical protein
MKLTILRADITSRNRRVEATGLNLNLFKYPVFCVSLLNS